MTPFSVLPAKLAKTALGQAVWAFVIFVGYPLALFIYWMIVNYSASLPSRYELLYVALPLGAVMVIANPYLFAAVERSLVAWATQASVDKLFGWNADRMREKERAFRRWYYPMCLVGVLAAIAIVVFAEPQLRPYAHLPSDRLVSLVLLCVLAAMAGFSAISDFHLVLRWFVLVRAGVHGAGLNWMPFATHRYESLRQAYKLSLLAAFSFSLGAVWIPLLFVINIDLGSTGQFLVWIFIVLLATGGLLAFVVPLGTILWALVRSKRRYRDSIDDRLGSVLDDFKDGSIDGNATAELSDRVVKILEVRKVVLSAQVIPLNEAIRRAFLTVIVPAVSLALSFWQTFSENVH